MDNFELLEKELDEISKSINNINYFKIIKKEKSETVHSDILAWLFNPQGNHNLQTTLLRRFASKENLHLTINQVKNALVKREFNLAGKKKDILITDNSTFFIAIENKIRASQGDEQLESYYYLLERKFWYIQNSNRHYYYLTPNGDEPNHNKWKIIDYGLIKELLNDILAKTKSIISNQTKEIIEQYINVIGRDVLKQDDIKEKCKELYKKYSNVLDMIFENRMEKHLIINNDINDIINEYDNLSSIKTEDKKVKFTSSRLFDSQKNKISKNPRNAIGPIYFEFAIDDDIKDKIVLYLKCFLRDLDEKYHSRFRTEILKNKLLFRENNDLENESKDGHFTLWKKEILTNDEYRNSTISEIREKLENSILEFNEKILVKYEIFFENFFKNEI